MAIQAAKKQEGYTTLPDGDYDLVIVKAEKEYYDKFECTRYKLRYQIGDSKRIVFEDLYENEKGAGRITSFFMALGKTVTDSTVIDLDPCEQLVGQTLRAKIITNEWKGEKNNKVKWYLYEDSCDARGKGATAAVGVDANGDPDDIPF